MQLCALLDSMECSFGFWEDKLKNNINVSVLYKATSLDYQKGYSFLKNDIILKHGRNFIDQDDSSSSFKDQVLKLFKDECEYTMFLVDDILFKNEFKFELLKELQNNKRAICASLRLAKHITHCYPTKQDVKVPQEVLNSNNKEIVSFKWKDAEGDWGYPMSADGHIFKTSFIKKVIDMIDFKNPNQMESKMAELANRGYFLAFPEMICMKDNSVLFNIPANRVQEEFKNRHGNLYTPEALNELFLKGQKIIYSKYWEMENNAPHMETEMEFWA
jgi:hypothetical protein